jgi:hypothetical protein
VLGQIELPNLRDIKPKFAEIKAAEKLRAPTSLTITHTL